MRAIIDLVLLGILIICTWSGYKKGILMGIGGILCIVVAVYGANLLANLFSYDVIPALKPFVSGYTEGLLSKNDSKVLKQMGWENEPYSVEDLLQQHADRQEEFAAVIYKSVGIDDTTATRMAEQMGEYLEKNGGTVMSAVVQVFCVTISYVVCFILAFLLIIIVLTVVGNLPNLSYKIPNLDLVNDIGGALLGLATGIMFCALLVWALKFMGMLIGTDTLGESILGGRLMRWDPLVDYLRV